MGYVGAFTYAEVISGYTSFFLGARSVCPTATMEVTFTGSWYDETAEKEGANKLIAQRLQAHQPARRLHGRSDRLRDRRCSQRLLQRLAPRLPAPTPSSFLPVSTGLRTMSTPSTAAMNGEAIDADWTGTLATGSVVLTERQRRMLPPPAPRRAVEAAKAELEDWHASCLRRAPPSPLTVSS